MFNEDKFDNELQNLKVLIADDDNVSYLYQSRILQNIGLSIIRAYNGLEAVDMSIEDPSIRLILMDISMPIFDGIKATRLIKSRLPHIPVIIVTAYTEFDIREEALNAQCDAFITKPIIRQELIDLVYKMISTPHLATKLNP